MKGELERAFVVACAVHGGAHVLFDGTGCKTKAQAALCLRERGWVLNGRIGWVCPLCRDELPLKGRAT